MNQKLNECFMHTNVVFVGQKTNICREDGKKGCIVYTTARPKGLIVFEDRTTMYLDDFNERTGTSWNNKNTSILAVYKLPDSAQPCTIEEIFAVPIEACEKIWELPRTVDDFAVDQFLKGE